MDLFIFRGLGLVDTRLKGWFGFHGVLFGLISRDSGLQPHSVIVLSISVSYERTATLQVWPVWER